MNNYTKELLKALEEDNASNGIEKLINKFLLELKKCVKARDVESFNILVNAFLDYGFNDIEPSKGKYNSNIRQYLYDLIMDEKYEFIKDWTDKQYGEIANSIILEKMAIVFSRDHSKLSMLTDEDLKELQESYLTQFLEFCGFTLDGILKDDWYFRNIKHRIEIYVYYSVFSLELMLDAISRIKLDNRDYLPNRKYTDEMFAYSDALYNDMTKRLKQEEVIIETLKKYEISIDKLDSYKVRWGIYRRKNSELKK